MIAMRHVGLCYSAYHHHLAHKQIRLPKQYFDENGIVTDYMQLSKSTYISGVCFMYNMAYKNIAGEFATTAGEDYLMAVKIAAISKVAYVDEVLGEWTNNPHGLSARLLRPNHGMSCAAAAEAMAFARANAK
jgi:hypothetical protein